MRCAVYTRQSVKRPGEDPAVASCALQRTLCTEFIRGKTWDYWYPIAEHFDDEAESGATLDRPGLAKLLRRIEDGDIRRVIVYRVDRLTRRLTDWARLVEYLQRHRVGLTVVHGQLNADAGSFEGFQLKMLAVFAEWERDIIRERIADARAAKKARGERSAGRVPLGYRIDSFNKQLVIDEDNAAVVRWFFDEAAKGTTTNDLVTKANKKKQGGKEWSSRAVLRLLQNETYTGRRPDGVPGRHASIIAQELFGRVQAIIDGRRTRTPTKRNERAADEVLELERFNPFILRGLLTCGACGKAMSPSMSKALTSKTLKALMKAPTVLPRYYRCRTVGCGRQVVAGEAERLAREIIADAPSDWPDEVKERMRVIAQAWPHMWPRTQRLALEELFESMSWHTEPERLEVVLCANGGA